MQIQKCSLLICQGQESSMQERVQQKICMNYVNNLKGSQHQSIKKAHHPKSVFSFKMNCHRNYHESDKNRWNPLQKQGLSKLSCARIQSCKSTKPFSSQLPKQAFSQPCNIRCFSSPPPRQIQKSFFVGKENRTKNMIDMEKNMNQQYKNPLITFEPNYKISLNKVVDPITENLASTKYSSKIRVDNTSIKQSTQATNNLPIKADDEMPLQWSFLQQKCSLKKSFHEILSNNSIHTQKVYPSFENLQSIQPRIFFENVNTIKTILTSSQLKGHSVPQSFKEFATHQISESQHDENNIKTFKNFARIKKKTAYFGFTELSGSTEKAIVNELHRKNHHNQDGPQQNIRFEQVQDRTRKVTFLLNSNTQNSQIEPILKFDDNKQNQKSFSKDHQAILIQPSLHNLVAESTQKQKNSIQNSIKQMQFTGNGGTEDNGSRFKYINTIKSIGGESCLSDNSYVDIKFMQSLNSKRAIIKLI